MPTQSTPRRTFRGSRAVATVLLAIGLSACSGSPAAVGSSGPSADPGDDAPPTANNVAVPGGWTGTITFHAVLDTVNDTSTSGQGTYQETTTEHDTTQADVTDTFTVTGSDPDDLSLGIGSVDLTGAVAGAGTTLERYVFVSDKYNALGCHWTGEIGSEVKGSWSGHSNGSGSIEFESDGSYRIVIGVGGDPATGELPPSPQLPKRLWEANTILAGGAKDCPGPGTEQMTTEGPVVEWASSILGPYDTVEGTLSAASPGSVVDGSHTFDIKLPEAKLTVTWHLEHDGPITLPVS